MTIANFKIDSTGIEVRQKSSEKNSLVTLKINAQKLPAFSCHRAISLGLHLGKLSLILKTMQWNELDLICVTYSPGNICVRLFHSSLNSNWQYYDIEYAYCQESASCPIDMKVKNCSVISFIPSSEFAIMTRQISSLSQEFKLSGENTSIQFEFQSDKVQGSITYSQSTRITSFLVSVKVNAPTSKKYKIQCISKLGLMSQISADVQICVSDAGLLEIQFDFPEGNFRFYAPPLITNDWNEPEGQILAVPVEYQNGPQSNNVFRNDLNKNKSNKPEVIAKDNTPANIVKSLQRTQVQKSLLDFFVKETPKQERKTELFGLDLQLRELISKNEDTRVQEKQHELEELERILKSVFPQGEMKLCGGFANGFNTKSSDLDVCFILDNIRYRQDFVFELLEQKLENSRRYKYVEYLSRAKVPIIKMDTLGDIGIDISLNNWIAVYNSQLLKTYAGIDQRVRDLGIAVKIWAKKRDICTPYHGTLSPYAYIILVIYFLQIRGIIPCLQQNVPVDQKVKIYDYDCSFRRSVSDWRSQTRELSTTGQLLKAFFDFYAAFDWKNRVVWIRGQQEMTKDDKYWWQYHIGIEDPFQVQRNLGDVAERQYKLVIQQFKDAAYRLHESQNIFIKRRNNCYSFDHFRLRNQLSG